MQEIKDKVQYVISKYEERLAANSIKIAVSKRYFETQVGERIGGTGNTAIFNAIDRARDRRKEKANGYNYGRNKYHCMVLSVLPTDKNLMSREYCKDYAFVLRKVERAHIGLEPKRIEYEEDTILSKVEKCILKILKNAERTNAQKVCKDTLLDALRYSSPKYTYKRRFLNKERSTWELIFFISTGVLALATAFIIWMVGNLVK